MEENSLNANNINSSDNITDNLIVLSTSDQTIENETGKKRSYMLATPRQKRGNYETKVKKNHQIGLHLLLMNKCFWVLIAPLRLFMRTRRRTRS